MARRRGFPMQTVLLLVGAIVLALVGGGLLWSSLNDGGEGSSGVPEGMLGVPVASIDLPAYTELRIDHFIDPRTGAISAIPLPEESILESTIVDARELFGRVLARQKSAGMVFRESDLLPAGTRPGIVAGIPPGQRALRIDASKVSGIVGLRQGDRFDLVATYPGNTRGGAVQSVYGPGARAGNRALARVVADGATVVSALEERSLPTAGGRTGAIVQEMVIALAPDEIPIVTEALEIAKRIDCIPRSGLPTDAPADDGESVAGARQRARSPYDEPMIDMIEGDRRSLQLVPENALPPVGAGPGGS